MAKQKPKALLKESGKYTNIYVLDAIAYYARVHEPQQKHKAPEGDREYHITLFVDEDTKDILDQMPVNKGFSKVGVDKIKKGPNRGNVKFPLDKYPDCEGLFGFKVSVPEFTKAKKKTQVSVVDKEGNKMEDLIGNGSKVNVKTLAWKNEDEEWNMRLNLVHVVDLVEYEGAGAVEDDTLGISYDVSASSSKNSDKDVDDDVLPFDSDDDDDDDDYA